MHISVGYELIYNFPQPTPMILAVNIHASRVADIVIPDILTVDPPVPITGYHDGFGNWCTRIVAPAGQVRLALSVGFRGWRGRRRLGSHREPGDQQHTSGEAGKFSHL